MAERIYFGTNSLARMVKKAFFGTDGVAREVKYGYIGIKGIAKRFFARPFDAVKEFKSGDWIKKTNQGATTTITTSKITLKTAAHYQSYAILISPAFDITNFTKVTITGDYGSGSGGDGAYIVPSSISTPSDKEPDTYDLYLGAADDGATKTFNISSLTGKKRLYLSIAPNYPEDLGGSTAVADTQYYTSIKFS